MSAMIEWIAAEAEPPEIVPGKFVRPEETEEQREDRDRPAVTETARPEEGYEELRDEDRERRIYRARTVVMLRRYMRYSLETGRLPSLLGREFFRAKVTKYQVTTFEDRVIFVHDMERCLERLDEFSRQILARVVLQEYDHWETARLLGCTRMTVHRRLLEALDQLSEILREVGLLDAVYVTVERRSLP
jgi:RNA polymerase sigma factor (sigma-70 family)